MSTIALLFNDNSAWWIPLCLLAGFVYARVLYPSSSSFSLKLRRLLFAFRFVVVTLLALLLLSPLIRMVSRIVEKPLIVIAQDNSSSILLNKQAAFYKEEYPKALKQFINELKDDYTVINYSFGNNLKEGISSTYSEKETDISQVITEVNNRYINRNVGAIIIASDGIYNKGNNPLYTPSSIKAPIYAIAMGDTVPQRDLLIASVNYNKIVYLGNDFQANVKVNSYGFKGAKTLMTIRKDGKTIQSKQISIVEDDFSVEIPLQLQTSGLGYQRYTIQLTPLNGEISTRNNIADIIVEVLDGKQKILLLAAGPHPDIAAIRQSIESNQNYELNTVFIAELDVNSLAKYDLVILYQLPTAEFTANQLYNKLNSLKLPVLFVLGNQVYIDLFNKLQTGLSIASGRSTFNEAQPVIANNFFLFTLSDETKKSIERFPPLYSPYGNYGLSAAFSSLLYQRIGSVGTANPLLTFNESTGNKIGILCGEGIWKWYLQDYLLNKNHDAINELLSKTIQYLSTKEDKRKLRVSTPKKEFQENEPVLFSGELYNDSYELINTPELQLEIKDSEGKKYPYVFSKTEKSYSLNAGMLPAGNYSYKASTSLGTVNYSAQGELLIGQLSVEELQTRADHQLLFNLAARSGGAMVYPSEMMSLAAKIKQNELIKPVSYEQKRFEELVNLKWFFFLLLAFLSVEWFLRKQNGSY